MKIRLTSVYVDDQDKALRFYTDVLGFVKKADFQQAKFQQGQPAAMFFTDDVQRDYERAKASGGEFKMPPTKVTGSTIAQVNDTCGNLIQITQLDRYGG